MSKMELLAPAGSPEAIRAAVHGGADAVYLGYGDFNARRNAKNLTREEFEAAVSYCHLHGVKVFLTLNTLINDRELPAAAELVTQASSLGADAVLVQDMGVVRMLRQAAPDLPIHASTQMTVHNLDGVKKCADLGMTRVVLSRELSKRDIGYICEHSPIEIETFVHGALCMCYSGQCYLSSVIGGRSGNRGTCAQPCRLAYGWNDKAEEFPLSLKDMSLANHLQELRNLGVACVKIEGRMKRAEYVYIVTEVFSRALKEGINPTEEDMRRLTAAFSRQGFTDSYFEGETGPHMFGIRQEAKNPAQLFESARAVYAKNEYARRVPVTLYAMVRPGEPVQVGAEDEEGRIATAAGDVPEEARTRPILQVQVEDQLSRTGGTPYVCSSIRSLVAPGLSVPLSALNGLRRQVLDDLSAQRSAPPQRRHGVFSMGARYANRTTPPLVNVSLRTASQLSTDLLNLKPNLISLPAGEISAHPETVARVRSLQIPMAVALPRVCNDRELPELTQQLEKAKELGVTDAFISNVGQIDLAAKLGFTVRGDFSLPVFNTQAIKEYKRLGLSSVTASFELKLAQIRDLSKALDTEILAYGRLPLMIMENCIIKNRSGRCSCNNVNILTDRKGVRFPVVPAPGCRNEILNSAKLFLADKKADYEKIGLWAVRLLFTTENAFECAKVTERYLRESKYEPGEFTRGLYYRDLQ